MQETEYRGEWIRLYSGRKFYLESPQPSDIHAEEIAVGLSRIFRFYGHTLIPISVAQHSILVSRNTPQPYKLQALLHDASEAYLGDVASPLKRILAPLYLPLEERVMAVIYERFGVVVTPESTTAVHTADKRAYATECRDLRPYSFYSELDPFPEIISRCWGWDESQERFLEELAQLWEG